MVPNVLVVNPAVPAKSVGELLAQARSAPGRLAYGSNGNGTGQHLIGAQFEIMGGGKLRPLAVTTAKRSPALPDVPTLDEAGLKGFDMGTWFGVLAPAGTPRTVIARLNEEIVRIIQSPDFRKRMDEIGAEPVGNTPEQMAAQIRTDTERFAKLVRDAKVSIE